MCAVKDKDVVVVGRKASVGRATSHSYPPNPAPVASSSRNRKPCGCGSVADINVKKQASTLLASIYGKCEDSAHALGATKPPAVQNKQTGCGNQTRGAEAVKAVKTQLPRYATSLARDTLHLMQTLCMALAIIMYYLVFSYVQLVYVILVSVFYFHNADGPMKLTLTVVVGTALMILYHMFQKLSKIFGK